MPIQRISSIPTHVREAINVASRETDASFDYLLQTAARESSFETNAKSRSSSAAGLFQFVESTWLKVVKEDGDRLGLGDYARHIKRTSSGDYHVPNSQARQKILALRHDAETAALVAGAFTENNARYVSNRIGREPSEQELYLAHFLGPSGAAKMIEMLDQRPDADANRHFPSAARSNKSIFYENGKPRSVSEVYDVLVAKHGGSSSSGMSEKSGSAFGGFGGLMSDISSSAPGYGKGGAGSIGVWGEEKSGANTAQIQPTSASAQHKQAASQYDAQSNATAHHTTTGSGGWMSDAFGGD